MFWELRIFIIKIVAMLFGYNMLFKLNEFILIEKLI